MAENELTSKFGPLITDVRDEQATVQLVLQEAGIVGSIVDDKRLTAKPDHDVVRDNCLKRIITLRSDRNQAFRSFDSHFSAFISMNAARRATAWAMEVLTEGSLGLLTNSAIGSSDGVMTILERLESIIEKN